MSRIEMIAGALEWVKSIRRAGGKPVTHIIDGATHPIGYVQEELPATLRGKPIEWDVTFSAGDGTGDGILVGHAKDTQTSSS